MKRLQIAAVFWLKHIMTHMTIILNRLKSALVASLGLVLTCLGGQSAAQAQDDSSGTEAAALISKDQISMALHRQSEARGELFYEIATFYFDGDYRGLKVLACEDREFVGSAPETACQETSGEDGVDTASVWPPAEDIFGPKLKRLETSVEWYRRSANSGDVRSQHNMGLFFLHDKFDDGVVPDNRDEAVKWFEMAANGGSSKSEYELGIQYLRGRLFDRDIEAAMYWFKRAVDHGNIKAMCRIGEIYAFGDGPFEQDFRKAMYWLNRADKSVISFFDDCGTMFRPYVWDRL